MFLFLVCGWMCFLEADYLYRVHKSMEKVMRDFRVNPGVPPFFLSAVPDIVLIEGGKVKGVMEVKSTGDPKHAKNVNRQSMTRWNSTGPTLWRGRYHYETTHTS